jgi:hypothetical protein
MLEGFALGCRIFGVQTEIVSDGREVHVEVVVFRGTRLQKLVLVIGKQSFLQRKPRRKTSKDHTRHNCWRLLVSPGTAEQTNSRRRAVEQKSESPGFVPICVGARFQSPPFPSMTFLIPRAVIEFGQEQHFLLLVLQPCQIHDHPRIV